MSLLTVLVMREVDLLLIRKKEEKCFVTSITHRTKRQNSVAKYPEQWSS